MKRTTVALLLLLAVAARAEQPPVRLDAAQRRAIGLTLGTAERRPTEKIIRTAARLDYDERRLADVTLKVSGYLEALDVNYTGQTVRAGEPLFRIYSPDLVTAEREYLLALETETRLRGSAVPGALDSATRLVRASRERLHLWDLSDAQIAALEKHGAAATSVVIRSPIAGVVVEKTAVQGQRVEPGMRLYRIADLSTLWAWAEVYELDLPLVRAGQEAEITLPSGPPLAARVAWVAPTLDPRTRTARVRFELPNTADSPLRPETYGSATIRVPMGERLVVPASAVLDSGRRQVVFVDAGDGRIVPHDVALGARLGEVVEIRAGLEAGERVVTSANFLVDSESQLAAAESMIGMMGALGMGGVDMAGARGMAMGSEAAGPEEKTVGDLRIAVFPARDPATTGENMVRVRVHDAHGAPVTGATVRFTYTMDMPGMAIEESAARELGDGVYEGAAKFGMGGPWTLVVEVAAPGKPAVREKFTLRVAS